MKKILCLVLSVCLMLGAVCFGEGAALHTTVSYMGEQIADILASAGNDEDGCYQFSLSGNAGETLLDYFLQVGGSSVVLGSGEELYEITYETVEQAVYASAAKYLGEENIALITAACEYIASGAYKDDLAIAYSLGANEATRLAMTAMQNGILTQDEAGNTVIELDQTSLMALLSDYAAGLADDSTVFGALAGMNIWQLAGLSADGSAEQAYVAAFAQQLAAVQIPAQLYIKAVITPEGAFTLEATCAEDGDSINLTASYDGAEFAAKLNMTVEGEEMYIGITASEGSIAYEVTTEDMSMTYDWKKVGSATYIEETATQAYDSFTVVMELNAFADSELMTLAYGAKQYLVMGETESLMLEGSLTFDIVNGLKLYVNNAGNASAVNLAIYASAAEDGSAVINAYLDATENGAAAATLNAAFNTATYALNGELWLSDEEVYTLTGALDETNVYTLSLLMNGAEIAVARQTVIPGMGIMGVIMGDLEITLANGITVTKTAEVTENGIVFNVNVVNGETVQTYKAGVNTGVDETGRTFYTVFVNLNGTEYGVTVAYAVSDTGAAGELKLYTAMGAYVIDIIDINAEFEMIAETNAHASGAAVSAEEVEDLIDIIIESVAAEFGSGTAEPSYAIAG